MYMCIMIVVFISMCPFIRMLEEGSKDTDGQTD